ncbi:protein kinase [Angomonas deanei]|uniref:Protein kinase domain/Protein tyrosine kinase/Kinase-like/Fungal protein kinase, putative n=1 Tax=Angomonas deanei TaxID=59799 RepID=A0A7G2CM68_9TRYP|nr:protein kinase [Angomonas deanei]CAD2220928.1 Protein kinase domain/Protein tyrosine kinase/Kinase-like/Fungal protein kinase, putative [Angomonas deanei]|eukprot:EPY21642.1 protein kinase [Angomonas deanei]
MESILTRNRFISTADGSYDRYLLTDIILGRGSFGAVHAGYRHEGDGLWSRTAVKVLKNLEASGGGEVAAAYSAVREAGVSRAITRGVRTFTPWFGPGEIYIPMEKMDTNLHEYVNQMKFRLPEKEISSIIIQCITAVAELHEKNFVHRDIKPENFLVKRTLSGPVVKLADFGFAASVMDDTVVGQFVGTLVYMSPEVIAQRRGKDYPPAAEKTSRQYIQARDAWSLGCTFYYLLTATHAFVGRTEEEVELRIETGTFSQDKKKCKVRPVFRTSENKEWAELILRCFVLNPMERITVAEMLSCLPKMKIAKKVLAIHQAQKDTTVHQPPIRGLFLCRPDADIVVYSAPSKSSAKVLSATLNYPYMILVEDYTTTADRKSTPGSGSLPLSPLTGPLPSMPQWINVLYPVVGYVRSEKNGQHLFHDFCHAPHSPCPSLASLSSPSIRSPASPSLESPLGGPLPSGLRARRPLSFEDYPDTASYTAPRVFTDTQLNTPQGLPIRSPSPVPLDPLPCEKRLDKKGTVSRQLFG